MSIVTFKVTGLAICNFKNGLDAYFLNHSSHSLKLIINDDHENSIPLGQSKIITITNTNATPVPDTLKPDKKTEIVNIDQYHPKPLKPILEANRIKSSKLSIPGAFCYTADYAKYEHEIWKKTHISNPTVKPTQEFLGKRKIASVIGADFNLDIGGNIEIKIVDKFTGASTLINLPQKGGLNYDVTFDNTCKECGYDFYLYYSYLDGGDIEIIEQVDYKDLPTPLQDKGEYNLQIACNPIEGCGEDGQCS